MSLSSGQATSLSPESFVSFGELLKYLRRRARLTQSELASAVGYSREQITKLENNQRLPELTTLKALFVPALFLDEKSALTERLIQLAQAARLPKPAQPAEAAGFFALRTNLITPLTSFVGRKDEIAEVKRLVSATRLLTLTGAGGVGKTRLASQVGYELLPDFADGVWLVELAALTDPTLIGFTVAAALGLAPVAHASLETNLIDYLRDKQLLLILDNCEHLLVACARLAELILRLAPHLRILATSRESLGVLSASAWNVPSLTLPSPDPAPSLEILERSEAVRLFVERATAARPGFKLAPQNAAAITQICRRLDGVPLALELAATRLRVMSAPEIATRLNDRFNLLNCGNSTALPRHQTLKAMIDWSYDLLTEPERFLLCQLAVFVGGWTLDAAEFVGGNPNTLDWLTQLVNKSLVVVEEHADITRYSLLETIAEYAHNQLAQTGMANLAHQRHLEFCLHLVEQAAPQLQGSHFKSWSDRLELEHNNLRSALTWATQHNPATALRLVARLWYFWFRNGYWDEGTAWAKRILTVTQAVPTADRAKALIGAANLAGRSGYYEQFQGWLAEGVALAEALQDWEYVTWGRLTQGLQTAAYPQAQQLFEEGLNFAQTAGNSWLMADVLFVYGERARGSGEVNHAATLYGQSLALFRQVGDSHMLVWPLGNLGRLAFQQGDYTQAQATFEECVIRCRELGNKPGTVDWLIQLALVALYRGDYQRSRSALAECLWLCRELGHTKASADCLVIAAGLAEANGQTMRAAKLLAATEMMLERFNTLHRLIDPESFAEYHRRRAAVERQLSRESLALLWAEGQAMSVPQAIEYALTGN
ncbi:MAG: tetratricopeptide repeat protein [Anaerolineae bacterium]